MRWRKLDDGSHIAGGYTISRSLQGGWELRWWGSLLDRLSTIREAKAKAKLINQQG